MMDLASAASQVSHADELLAAAMGLVSEQLGSVLAIAWMYNFTDQKLEYRVHVDTQRIETAELIAFAKTQRFEPSAEVVAAQAYLAAVPQVHAKLDSEIDVLDGYAAKAGLRSSFAVPIRNKYRVLGVLQFYCRKMPDITEATIGFLNELGTYLGVESDHKLNDEKLKEIQAQEMLLQEQLRATADDAVQAARLKSEFVANVSHEIRTPLAGIMGMAEMLATKENIDEETKDLAGYILSSAHSLLAIVNDLLDFSKLEAGKLALHKTWFSIHDFVENIAISARVSADKKGLRVRTRVDERLPERLLGDNARLTQIMHNFAHNGVKFTERGEITISADFESRLGNTIKVRFSVSDTGIGISTEAQRKLFQPFVQADGSTTRRFGGTGLGLSIAKKLTQLMDGEVGLDSEEGVGSTFYVILPLELDVEELIG